jgi:hypothetical protein
MFALNGIEIYIIDADMQVRNLIISKLWSELTYRK